MKKINGVGQTKDGIDLYSKTDFLGMHKAGMLAAQILDEIGEFVYPGQSTEKIDEIIEEPLGGAHRDKDLMLKNLKNSIMKNLKSFKLMSGEEILNHRKNKFLKIGREKGFTSDINNLSYLKTKDYNFKKIFSLKKILVILFCLVLVSIFSLITFL